MSSYDWRGFPVGMRALFGIPGLVMISSFLGFGAFVRSLGLQVDLGWYTTLFIWALPGQVVFLTMLAQGAGLIAIALAVTLTAVRLLPMVMLVLSKSRLEGQPRWPEYLAAHLIAITLWVIADRSLDRVPREQRLPWVMGIGTAMILAMLMTLTAGFYLSEALPPLVAIALVFMTPTFFGLSLVGGASYAFDYLAIGLAAALTPVGMIYFPQVDLLFAGVVGGLAAFLLLHPRRRRRR
ncbi:AzlC family ABC transporter permease [Rhodoligotrophos defluvii]|uniref:AzlC family ABC transporter permease n=1 Tax=Rhodoligotrophos defluvii TaxID=2561934 RepID=UPI0010C9AC93|nr:AzlC family ABC transporter permease [Rhodoligotrophos defluvii]